jgi:hypothetical protein
MNMRMGPVLAVVCALAAAAACGKDKSDEPGSSATSGAEKAVKDADKAVDEAAEDTGDKVEEATE